MPGVFISYRREDASSEAGRIADWLRFHFGADKVFIDVSAIEPGVDFVDAINRAVGSADVLLVVIGRTWLGEPAEGAPRRIDDPHDFVRIEVASALARGIRVIPLLVRDAVLPSTADLPEDLRPLLTRNALELIETQWEAGMTRLIGVLEPILRPDAPAVEPQRTAPVEASPEKPLLPWPAAIAALLGLLALLNAIHVSFVASPGAPSQTLLRRSFGGQTNFHDSEGLWRLAGFFSALPTIGVVIAGIAGMLLASRSTREGRGLLGLGLLCGVGLVGAARFIGALAWLDGGDGGFALALLGAAVVLALGLAGVGLDYRRQRWQDDVSISARTVALAGSVLSFVSLFIAFNGHGAAGRAIDHRGETFDLLVLPIVTVAVLLAPRLPRLLTAGFLVAAGFSGALAWLRYIAVPAMQNSEVASFGAYGAFIGIAGAILVWRAGRRLSRGGRVELSDVQAAPLGRA